MVLGQWRRPPLVPAAKIRELERRPSDELEWGEQIVDKAALQGLDAFAFRLVTTRDVQRADLCGIPSLGPCVNRLGHFPQRPLLPDELVKLCHNAHMRPIRRERIPNLAPTALLHAPPQGLSEYDCNQACAAIDPSDLTIIRLFIVQRADATVGSRRVGRYRFRGGMLMARFVLLAWVLVAVSPLSVWAQTSSIGADEADTALKTPDGAPNLQGVWDYRTMTPLERPTELGEQQFFSAEEASAFQRQGLDERNKDQRASEVGADQDVRNAYNEFWWDYGKTLTADLRTSLIVDPSDGQIPYRPGRDAARRTRGYDGPESRGLWERCVTRDLPRLSGAYNNNFQIIQSAEHVAIINEMIHEVRVIPLDGRPHVADGIRQWQGDPRGRWDGDTLVVETTNFTDQTSFRGSRENLHLVERFTRVDGDTLLYEFTVEDPTVWTQPWSVMVPMLRNGDRMYEYACHEGNYGMTNLLTGARVQERVAVGAGTADSSK